MIDYKKYLKIIEIIEEKKTSQEKAIAICELFDVKTLIVSINDNTTSGLNKIKLPDCVQFPGIDNYVPCVQSTNYPSAQAIQAEINRRNTLKN